MKAEDIKATLNDIPHMSLERGRTIEQFIYDNDITDILELGFAHGVSTCYMAGALQDRGKGSIVSIDLLVAKELKPNIEELVKQFGYGSIVEYYFESTSYTWRLMKFLEKDSTPRFDLCYIDGSHSWFIDGFAFFLSDLLLRPGGWIIFDDLDWTYATSPALSETSRVKAMPAEERDTPQIRKVYELLVKTHPAYDHFMVRDGWAYAHKARAVKAAPIQRRTEIVYITPHSLAALSARKLYPLVGKAYPIVKKIFGHHRNSARSG